MGISSNILKVMGVTSNMLKETGVTSNMLKETIFNKVLFFRKITIYFF